MDKTAKLLIVDDDGNSRLLLKGILQDYTNIYEAQNGAEALTFLQRNPDTALIITDIIMPVMDGLELLIRLRLSPFFHHTPVIVLTGSDDTDMHIRALELGATEFAPKPFESLLLRRRIANLLEIPADTTEAKRTGFSHRMRLKAQMPEANICAYELQSDLRSFQNIYFSPSFAESLGFTRAEFAAMVREDSEIPRTMHPEDQRNFRQAMEALAANRQPFCETFRAQKKDGTFIYLTVYADIFAETMDHTILALVILPQEDTRPGMPHRASDAGIDRLTGIANRSAFFISTRKLLNEHPSDTYILILINIDRFKIVNDLFGTKVGDNILIQAAAAIRDDILGRGTFGRLDADTFAICVPERTFSIDNLLRRQALLSESLGLSYNLTGHSGLYIIDDRSLEISQMCDRARLALASVKDNYMQRYAYYDESMRQEMLAEQDILNNMHQALEREDFVPFLQPIYSLHFDRPVSAEVLVRWKHPEKELVPPGSFIPLFEKNRFITNLDHYIWEQACRYIAHRRDEGLSVFPLSVNVSRMNLFNPELVSELKSLLRRYKVQPSLLRLEITESAYMDNPQQLIDATHKLQQAGFKILIDDFGSGFSSLNMLKDIPLDILKIDMKFLNDLENSSRAAAILLGIVNIAQHLGMITVAEGVETQFQLDFLRTAGCDNIQGFFYAKPMPMAEFDKFLDDPPMIL